MGVPVVAGSPQPGPSNTAGTRQKKNTPGKTFLHGADRTVRFYKPTEAELDRLGDLSRDEANAWARMAFCIGLLVDVILGMLFSTGLSAGSKGAGEAIGFCAVIGIIGRYYIWQTQEAEL